MQYLSEVPGPCPRAVRVVSPSTRGYSAMRKDMLHRPDKSLDRLAPKIDQFQSLILFFDPTRINQSSALSQ
jgi:hypothetical protein